MKGSGGEEKDGGENVALAEPDRLWSAGAGRAIAFAFGIFG